MNLTGQIGNEQVERLTYKTRHQVERHTCNLIKTSLFDVPN